MNIWNFVLSFGWLPWFIMGLIGFILGWLLKPSRKVEGDLSVTGEGALRSENDGLRTRIADLEASLTAKDAEVSNLSGQLATTNLTGEVSGDAGDDDETYALEWRNRYLAARVKYLESRLAEAPAPKAKKKAPAKKKAASKKAAPKKATAKAQPAPKVLYTDGPTDGEPDDLKQIKGIGPKFEKDLNGKGVYYFRQIAAWKKKDVEVVEKVIDSIPGRIDRDEWVPQAKGLTKGAGAPKVKKKPGPKPGTKRGATNLDGTPRKKPGPKPSAAKADKGPANAKYHENVHKFDPAAKTATIDNIVKYLGVALRSRDSSLVACSDPTEVNTVVTNLMVKKLGVDKEKGETIVQDVCTEMKSERFKNRVTFYYLCAKKARKLGVFA